MHLDSSNSAAASPRSRVERDSLGEVAVPADALYGAQTQRAIETFPLGGGPGPEGLVRALLAIKRAAARANGALGLLPPPRADQPGGEGQRRACAAETGQPRTR